MVYLPLSFLLQTEFYSKEEWLRDNAFSLNGYNTSKFEINFNSDNNSKNIVRLEQRLKIPDRREDKSSKRVDRLKEEIQTSNYRKPAISLKSNQH